MTSHELHGLLWTIAIWICVAALYWRPSTVAAWVSLSVCAGWLMWLFQAWA